MIPEATYANPDGFGACSDAAVPVVSFNECAEAVVQDLSEVAGVLVALPDASDPTIAAVTLVDESDVTEWEALFTAETVAHEYVIGDLPEPEVTEKPISRGRVKKSKKLFTLNVDIDESTQANYDAMRARQDEPEFFIWFYTLGNKIFGGTTGIRVKLVKAAAPLQRGAEATETYIYQYQWEADTNPPRNTSPFTL